MQERKLFNKEVHVDMYVVIVHDNGKWKGYSDGGIGRDSDFGHLAF